jgi:hypothetical protein
MKAKMRLFEIAVLGLVAAVPSLVPASLAEAASDCSMSAALSDWGQNSTGYIDIKSGESCQFSIMLSGTVSASDISQAPAHGKLKRLNTSTFEYKAKARYKGNDTFAIKATGHGPAASGTSLITVHATVK